MNLQDWLWQYLDPWLNKWGLTKTEAWVILGALLTILNALGYIPAEWVDFVQNHPLASGVAYGGPLALFMRHGTHKAQTAAEKAKPYAW